MCDFNYPYYPDGKEVERIGSANIGDPKPVEPGCYTIGHSGSFTIYWDGQKEYMPGEDLPNGLVWKDTLHYNPYIISEDI